MPYRPQSANRLTECLHAAVRSVVAGVGDANFLVACSGGTDSMCLAHVVVAVGRQENWNVTIAHVRHGVRLSDRGDRAAVRVLAARLDVAFVHESLTWRSDAPLANVSEAALRVGRYAALARMARGAGAGAIITGHTMDDQAETMLLHLIRGTGLAGLAGMKANSVLPVGEDNDDADRLHLVRPLLGIRREETAAYCTAHGLPVIHDPSNADQTWTRNWLRHTVIPELRTHNPDIAHTLSRTAGLFAADAQFLEEETQRAFVRAGLRQEAKISAIDYRAFVSEPTAVRIRMVRSLLVRYCDATPGADLIIDADATLSTARSSRIIHFGMMACAVIDGRLIVGASHDVRQWIIRWSSVRFPLFHGILAFDIDKPLALHVPDDSANAYRCTVQSLDARGETLPRQDEEAHYLAFPADARLSVRNRLPGDRFQPVGRPRAVALSDYLSGRGVPALVRDWLPLLVVNDTIAWVIGHDVGAPFTSSPERATHIALLQRRSR